MNLLKIVKDQVSDNFLNKASEVIGGSPASTQKAIGALIPSFMGSVVTKASTESGASDLLSMIKNGGYNSNAGSTEMNLMNNKTNEILSKGENLVSKLMGNNADNLVSRISSFSNLTKGGTSKLLSMVAPMVMGAIGKQVSQNNLNANGLRDLIKDQSQYVRAAMPQEMESLDYITPPATKDATSKVISSKSTAIAPDNVETSSGGGLFKWLVPLLLIGGLLFWFLNKDKDVVVSDNVKTEVTSNAPVAKDEHAGHNHADHSGHNHSTTTSSSTVNNAVADLSEGALYTEDEAGNLVDKNGNIAYKVGSFKSIDGYYVDEEGNKLGKALGAVKDAVVGAANATASAFTGLFSKMLKKEEGAKKTYLLTNISFDKESHKITNFSKGEVEGLASALKEYPDSKIEVQNYTTEGEKVSFMRAMVVKHMLVTLGVPENQIKSKGMGDSDKVKASGNKVEIVIK